jgi:hypothetical protein
MASRAPRAKVGRGELLGRGIRGHIDLRAAVCGLAQPDRDARRNACDPFLFLDTVRGHHTVACGFSTHSENRRREGAPCCRIGTEEVWF